MIRIFVLLALVLQVAWPVAAWAALSSQQLYEQADCESYRGFRAGFAALGSRC